MVFGWVSVIPVLDLPTRILSISDMLENSVSILDIRLSSVIPDRIDLSSASSSWGLVKPIVLVYLSFTVPNVDVVFVSNWGINVSDVVASLGRVGS